MFILSDHPRFFSGVRVDRSLVFYVVMCRSFFVLSAIVSSSLIFIFCQKFNFDKRRTNTLRLIHSVVCCNTIRLTEELHITTHVLMCYATVNLTILSRNIWFCFFWFYTSGEVQDIKNRILHL